MVHITANSKRGGMLKSLLVLISLSSSLGFATESYSDRLRNEVESRVYRSSAARKQVIAEMVRLRCWRYLERDEDRGSLLERGWRSFVETITLNTTPSPCTQLGASFAEALDLRFSRGLFMVFHQDLKILLEDSLTYQYLSDLEGVLKRKEIEGFNLFDFTQIYTSGDQRLSLKMIALLFQDISSHTSHLKFMQRELDFEGEGASLVFKTNVELLAKVLGYFHEINLIYHRHPDLKNLMSFYPKVSGFDSQVLPGSFYHFYVPAYMASKMRNVLGHEDTSSVFAPYIFNLVYEMIHSPNGGKVHLLSEAPRLKDDYAKWDSYSGLAGAMFGAEIKRGIISYSDYESSVEKDLPEFLTNLPYKVEYLNR